MRKVDLRGYLANLPRPRLQAIAEKLGLPSQKDLVSQITKALSSAEIISALLELLSPEARALLRNILYADLQAVFDPDEAHLEAPDFRELYDSGLVGIGKEYWGTVRIVIPEEIAAMALRFCTENDARRLTPIDDEAIENIRSKNETFLRNVTTIVAIAEGEGIPLTITKDIPKPFLNKKLLPLLEVGDYGNTENGRAPNDISCAWNFAIHCGILVSGKNSLEPGPMVEAFLESPDEIIGEALLSYAAETRPKVPLHWLIDLMRLQPAGAWFELEAVLDAIAPDAFRGNEEWRGAWRESLLFAEMIGLLDFGQSAGREVVALSSLLSTIDESKVSTTAIIVSPDFKISAPRNLARSVRRQLSKFARFVKSDLMDQWEITQSSVARAIDEGFSAARIVEALAAHSAFPPPKNVAESIRIWEEHRKNVIFHHGPILIVEDASEERSIREILSKANALLAQPAPNVFILHPKKADAVLEKIRARRDVGKIPAPSRAKAAVSLSDTLRAKHAERKTANYRSNLNIVSL